MRVWRRRALGDRLAFVDDVSFSVEAAQVTLWLRDGKQLSRRIIAARGSLESPLDEADLASKLATLVSWGGSGCEPRPLCEAVWALEESQDASVTIRGAEGR